MTATYAIFLRPYSLQVTQMLLSALKTGRQAFCPGETGRRLPRRSYLAGLEPSPDSYVSYDREDEIMAPLIAEGLIAEGFNPGIELAGQRKF